MLLLRLLLLDAMLHGSIDARACSARITLRQS